MFSISFQFQRNVFSISFSKLWILLFVLLNLVSINGLSVLNKEKKHKAVLRTKTSQTKLKNKDVCSSEYCIKTAKELLQSIDETVNPCTNFYEFTCGKWIKNTILQYRYIAETQSVRSKMQKKIDDDITDLLSTPPPNGTVESKAITNARRLFDSCTTVYDYETGDVFDILSLIDKEFGGWPTWNDSAWGKTKFDLSEILLRLSHYDFRPFYDAQTKIVFNYLDLKGSHDRKNSTINEGQFTNSYKYIVFDLSSKLRTFESTFDTSIKALYNFGNSISEYVQKYLNQNSDTTRTTVRHLSETIGTNFDFGDYLRRLYLAANITLHDDDIVVVNNIKDIRNISSTIAQQSITTLQEYIIREFLTDFGLNISTVKNIINGYPTRWFDGLIDIQLRRTDCAKWVNSKMGFAVSKLFIDKYYDKQTHAEAMKMLKNIQETFIDMISSSTWMDSISKKKAIEKIQSMIGNAGYPDYMYNDNMTKLENLYEEYNFDSFYMKNVLILSRLKAKEYFQKLREPNGFDEWFEKQPTTSTAYYVSTFNKIVLPVAYIIPNLFHKDAPKYLNYGGTGYGIGHELGHAFDSSYRHLDKDGKKYFTWSGKVNERFVQRTKCIVEQYSKYEVSQISRTINAYKTLNENDADDHGLKIAFNAYQKWIKDQNITEKKLPGLTKYTPEQLFFINYGYQWCSKMNDPAVKNYLDKDVHAYPEFRINGPTSNFIEFDRVFQCTPGQGNSRVNKCGIW